MLTAFIRVACTAGLLAMLCPALSLAAQAKPMRFDRLSLDEGLSQSAVLAILQDSEGFMWFGTEDGLNRYDGYAFTQYKRERGTPGSLVNDFIFDIDEDRQGNLWIATDGGGVSLWDRTSDRFTNFRHDPADVASLASNITRTLLIDVDGYIWIGTRGSGLDRLDPRSGVFTHYRHDPGNPASLASDEVYALFQGSGGRIWVGTNAGVSRLDPVTGRFDRFQHAPGDARSLSHDQVRAVYQDSHGTLWVGTKGGLNRFEGELSGFTRLLSDPQDPNSLSDDHVRTLFEDHEGRLWVGTAAGLNLMDRANGRFTRYLHEAADPSSLGDDYVMSLYEDRGGVLWVGTKSAGLSKWNPRTWALGHRAAEPEVPTGLASPNVTSFAEGASGQIWIGTFGGGLHAMDRKTGQMTRFAHDATKPDSPSGDRVMSLLRDSDGMLWVGTLTSGLNRLDIATGRFEHFRHEPQDVASLAANGVMALLEDGHGGLWIGTFGGGLNKLDRASGTVTRFAYGAAGGRSLGSSRATSLAEDRSGRIWIGTDGGGLALLDPGSGRFYHYRHDPDDVTSLAADTVYSLLVDSQGAVWIGTRGGGLDRVQGSASAPASVSFQNVSETDGLPNDVVYGIREDRNGDLWLSTNRGLSRYNPLSGEVKNFHVGHGLQAEEFNFGAHYVTRDGELFFGGPRGFNAFFPEQLETNEHSPAVVMTAFDKYNRPVKSDVPYGRLDGIELGYKDDVVSFEFSALDFSAPSANRYAYMLEGFHDDWIDLGLRRRVSFTDLDAGHYVLRVKAANGDGVWNEAGLSIPLRVQAAPWETWWAYAAYALLVLLAIGAYWRLQQLKLEREARYARRLEREVRKRTEDLADRNSELETLNVKLTETSLTDPLTGLRNRRFLFEQISKDTDLVDREYSDRTANVGRHTPDMVFMMVDLDHFKPINDSFGHAAGDEVLLQVRDVLLSVCRSSDFVIRWGGDEFLVVARNITHSEAEALAERIRSELAERVFVLENGQVARTTCSIGFSCYPFVRARPGLMSWEQTLGLADSAMYEAKKSRNAWVGFLSTAKAATSRNALSEGLHPSAFLFQSIRQGRLEVRSSSQQGDGDSHESSAPAQDCYVDVDPPEALTG